MRGLKKSLSVFMAVLCLFGLLGVSSFTEAFAADRTEKGEIGGYIYEAWSKNGKGTLSFKNTADNGFTADWDKVENAAAIKGISFEDPDDLTDASQLRDYTVTYDVDINYMNGNSYAGACGSMDSPQAEFLIVDSWGSKRPTGNGTSLGTIRSNGVTYDIYGYPDLNKTLLTGETVYKYLSVSRENLAKKTDDTCNVKNSINICEHFKAWSSLGLSLGYMRNVSFGIEAFGSSGSASVNSLECGGRISDVAAFGPEIKYKKHSPAEPDAYGRTVYIDFETDRDDVGTATKYCSAEYDTDHSYSGERSFRLSSSGRSSRSFYYEIDPYDFRSHELWVGAKVFQNSGKDVVFTLSYIDSAGDITEQSYGWTIYEKTIRSGKWTDIEISPFVFYFSKLEKCGLKISVSEPTDFWVDDLYIIDSVNKDDAALLDDVRGDLNGDGVINVFDVLVCRETLLDPENMIISKKGDVNGDYRTDTSDLVLLTQFILRKKTALPDAGTDAEYYGGDYAGNINGSYFHVHGQKMNSEDVRTVVREDGSFAAEWHDIRAFYIEKTSEIKDSSDLKLKYSADMKTVESESDKVDGKLEFSVNAVFKKGNSDLNVYMYEGYDTKYGYSNIIFLGGSNDFDTIELGGEEYYIYKERSRNSYYVWLYRKNSPLACDEEFHIENDVDLSKILKYAEMEDYVLSGCRINVDTDITAGYVAFSGMTLY